MIMVTKTMLKNALIDLGVEKGMVLEVHSSLSSFGEHEGGAETVINTLKEIVTEEGSIFMPALRLSPELPLSEEDKELGITVKIKVLPPGSDRTAMGIVADTFRKLPDTYTGQEVISTSGWGKHGKEALTGGLDFPIHNGGKALMLGVDIYKLTAMHYVEDITPEDINNKFKPTDEINRKYPPDEWFMEAGHPPVKAWYKIQDMAYEKGLIRETAIGDCKVMFFDIWSVVSLYENELKRDPYGLWGLNEALDFQMEKLTENMIRWAESKLGSTEYAGWCLAFIEDALEISNHIEVFGGDSARESYELYKDALRGGAPERGAFVFYDCLCPSENGPVNWGHCGISLGDGRVIHAWDMVRIDDYPAIEKLTALTGDHPKYLGWVALDRVLNQKPGV